MLIELSNNLKNLRRKKDLTQEQVAEFLNITPQSVSRWETAATYPDIEMLPLLGKFYGVSVDYLLGFDTEAINADIEQYKEKRQCLRNKGDMSAAYDLTREYYVKYPSDKFVMYAIVEDTYMKARNTVDDTESEHKFYNEAIELAKRHVTQVDDGNERCEYYKLIAYSYKWLSDLKTAMEYIKMLPDLWNCKETTAGLFYENKGRVNFYQDTIVQFADRMQSHIRQLADADYTNEATPYTFDERIEALKKINDVYDILFENGDFGFYHTRLYFTNRVIAACYANKKDVEQTLFYLDKSKYHAITFDNLSSVITHTSLLVKNYKMDSAEWSFSAQCNSCYELLDKLEHERYDFLRDNEKFFVITDELKLYAKRIK